MKLRPLVAWTLLALPFLAGCPTSNSNSLSVSPRSVELEVGQTTTLVAVSSANGDTLTWVSDNTGVATVSNRGRVSTLTTGTARITVTSGSTGLTASSTVNVVEPAGGVELVTVSPSAATVSVGGTVRLNPASTGEAVQFLWYSEDETVAVVDQGGLVTGVSNGTAEIVVRGASPVERAIATITVVEPVIHKVTISPLGLSILEGGQATLTAESTDPLDEFEWFSEFEATATVDENGVVQGVQSGGVVVGAQGTNSGAFGITVVDVFGRTEHSVSVSPSLVTLEAGKTFALQGKTTREGGTLSWSSEDTTVATVDEYGLVRGVSEGMVSISAQGIEPAERSAASVRVIEGRLRTATVLPRSVSVPVGDSVEFRATSVDITESFDWIASDTGVAIVDEMGVAVAVGPGMAQIEAVGRNTGATGLAFIEVTEAVSHQITIAPSAVDIEVGEEFSFSVSSSRPGDRISWSSNDEDLATVSESGVVTGVGVGAAVVTATGLDSGASNSVVVTVSEATVHVLSLRPHAVSIGANESITLIAASTDPLDTFDWFSSDELVAVVNQSGIVSGVEPGTVEITVIGRNSGESALATVTVTQPVVHQLRVSPKTVSVDIDATVRLGASSTRTGDVFIWTSDNGAVATVDSTGLVRGVSEGAAVITVEGSLSGAADMATVNVSEPVVEVALVQPVEASILVGESIPLGAESSDSEEAFQWVSADAAVATVDGTTGVVTGVSGGSVVITATGAETGATGTSTITVVEPILHEVIVSPAQVLVSVEDAVQLNASTTREGDSFTWSTSDASVAEVTQTGLVTGLSAGTAVVSAQGTVANERGMATVTVTDPVAATVTIDPLGTNIIAGTSVLFRASSTDPQDGFTWSTGNTSVASVDSDGMVLGVSPGMTAVRVRGTHSGLTAAAAVTVSEPEIHFVTVQPLDATLEAGDTLTLVAASTDASDSLEWTSADSAIAAVDASGNVTAQAIGTTTISVTGTNSGLSAHSEITVIDTVPPTIAIGGASVPATRRGPLEFNVTYGGAHEITLSKDDITLNATGSVSALLGNVVTTGAQQRTVKIDTVAGDGTLSISIAPGTARDAAGNMAPAAGPSTVVLVDNSAPTLAVGEPSVGRTNTGPVDYRVIYNGADQISLAKANVLVNGTGTVAATLANVTGSGVAERTVTFSSLSGDGTVGITIAEGTAQDSAGNQAAGAGPSTTVVVDNTPPTITIGAPSVSTTNDGPITFRVTYDGADEITLSDEDIMINGTGLVAVNVDDVTETEENVRTVTISNVAGDGTVGISIAEGTASDAAGNLAPATGPSATVVVDNTAPTLAIGDPSVNVTSAGPVVYPVTYQGADTVTLDEDDITVTGTDTALAQVTEVAETGEGAWNITLGNAIGNGTFAIAIAAGTAADNAGNLTPAAGPSSAVEVNNIAPTLLISEPSLENTFEDAVAYTITYADAAAVALAPTDIALNSDDGVTADIAITGTGATQRTVTLSNFTGTGQASISIAAATATNSAAVPAGPAGPSQAFQVNPLLEPGTGFTEPTPQPAPIGDPGAPGIDAKAIARWDVVPYQTFDGYFEIGVVAFHINDIDRVEFSVDNGPWLAVREMTLNPRTGVVEYWVGLDARDFADGPIEVRAIAYPKVGEARVLQGEIIDDSIDVARRGAHSIVLWTNSGGSLGAVVVYVDSANGSDESGDGTLENPYASATRAAFVAYERALDTDEVAINLLPGDYVLERKVRTLPLLERWTIIQPAPGVETADVRIVGTETSALGVLRIALKEVSIIGSVRLAFRTIWLDGVYMDGQDFSLSSNYLNDATNRGGAWVTDTIATRSQNVLRGATFYRNYEVPQTSGSPFGNGTCVIKSRVGEFVEDRFHADIAHWLVGETNPDAPQADANLLIYNVEVEDFDNQGFFAEVFPSSIRGTPTYFDNAAFVNLTINENLSEEDLTLGYANGPWEASTNHLLIQNVNAPNNVLIWLQEDYSTVLSNVKIVNSRFYGFRGTMLPVQTIYYGNEILRPDAFGVFVPPDYIP